MKYGIIQILCNAAASGLFFFKGSNSIRLQPPASIPASFDITLLASLPGSTSALTIDASGNLGTQALGGGGTVTSVALTAPSIFTVAGSPVTTSGTLALSLSTQTANTFFAGPSSGGAAAPTFRGIVFGDLSGLVGTGVNTIAAGNDSRFHVQGTDTGTTAISFQINSGATGVRLKDSSGNLRLRNAADTADADLIVGNLQVTGTTTTVNSETVTIDDNIIVLNNNVSTGTPTEDGGVQVRRGASTSAAFIWTETGSLWKAGLAGSEIAVSRYVNATFTNATLVSGILTITHNLGRQFVPVTIADNSNKQIIPDEVTFGSANSLTIDLTSYGTLTGTWNYSVG
jgi:hypothetical protein